MRFWCMDLKKGGWNEMQFMKFAPSNAFRLRCYVKKFTAIETSEMGFMEEGDFARSGFNQDIARISYWLQRPWNAMLGYLVTNIDQP